MQERFRVAAPTGKGAERDWLLLAIILAALLYLSFAPALFNDGDTSWHLAAGRLMIDRATVPDTDPFSFTAAGTAWTAHEWLAEVLMAGVFALGSWSALALLFSTTVAGLLLLIGLEARRWLPGTAVAAILLLVLIVLTPSILARPHVLAWPLLAGWTIALVRARESGRAPAPWTALLMVVWANLHGSFVFGLVLVGAFGLDALLADGDRRRTIINWGSFGLLSLLAAIVTPHGFHGLLFPLQLTAMKSLPLISEWRPTRLGLDEPGFTMALFGTLLCAALVRPRLPPARLLLLIAILFLAFQHVRHQAVLAIVGALLLAPAFAKAQAPPLAVPPLRTALLLTAALTTFAVLLVRPLFPASPPDSGSNPVSAIAHVPSPLRGVPVFNSYGFGGPLILAGIRPFIDGRADMYGDAFMFDHDRIVRGDLDAFDRAVRRWTIGWLILAPGEPLAAKLDRRKGWRRIHSDRWAIIYAPAPRNGL